MGAFVEKVRAEGGRLCWVDYVDYAGRLLSDGTAPWLDPASCGAWLRKAQGLLRSDVVVMPLGRIAAAWLDGRPALRDAMAARSRAVYPLKTLLGDDALRSALIALLASLRGNAPGTLFALSCPSPRAWVAAAYRQAHATDTTAGEDEADAAAPYIADFLRSFGESPVDALELVETEDSEPEGPQALECYRSVRNVAAHYRWDAGLRVPGRRYAGGGGDLDFLTGAREPAGDTVRGIVLPAEFWKSAPAPEAVAGTFRYLQVPRDAEPERVLDRLLTLR